MKGNRYAIRPTTLTHMCDALHTRSHTESASHVAQRVASAVLFDGRHEQSEIRAAAASNQWPTANSQQLMPNKRINELTN